MNRFVVLRVVAKLLIPFILMFGFYVQMHGDYGPGGGFQAGVIIASAFILHGIVFEVQTARRVVPMKFLILMSCIGLLLYSGVGIANLIYGGQFLEYGSFSQDPMHGNHTGIIIIEIGVGITVAAIMLIIFFSFSRRQ